MIETCRACGMPNQVACERLGQRARCATCMRSLLPLVRPHAVHSQAELNELVEQSPLPVVVDFWSSNAPEGSCRAVDADLERMARQRSGGAIVAKVDTRELPEMAARFGVDEVPTLIVFRGGREEARSAGAHACDLLRAV